MSNGRPLAPEAIAAENEAAALGDTRAANLLVVPAGASVGVAAAPAAVAVATAPAIAVAAAPAYNGGLIYGGSYGAVAAAPAGYGGSYGLAAGYGGSYGVVAAPAGYVVAGEAPYSGYSGAGSYSFAAPSTAYTRNHY